MDDDKDFVNKLKQMQVGDRLVFVRTEITPTREGAVFQGHRSIMGQDFEQDIFLGKKRTPEEAEKRGPWTIAIEYV